MKPERWQQVDRLFQAALALDPADRASFLDHACKEDRSLRFEVESLLDSHDSAGSFISSPAVEANPSLMETDTTGSILHQRIGPYLILSQIGAGGMGEVFLAQDTRLGRKVALKLLPDYFTRDEKRVRRFQTEARAASALNHPNIITIHDIGEVEGRHYIATEFVEGETLRQVMARGRANIRELLDIAVQVASAVASAHQAGIVHRDIKPENVMLRPDGLVKVLDFGLAKLTQSIATGTQAPTLAKADTDPGAVMGTVNYMSPEQARGQEVDTRSDIFSLGVVIYEMVAGRAPFDGESPGDVIAAILQKEPAPLIRYEPEASTELQWMVNKTLRKDREERYQTVKEMLSDLREMKEELQHQAKLERSASPEMGVKGPATTGVGQAIAETAGERAIQTGEAALRTTSSAEYLIGEIKRHKRGVAIALTAVAVAIVGVTLVVYKNRGKSAVPFQIGKADRLTHTGKALDAAISPDGKFVVYVLREAGQESLWARDVATNTNVPIVPPAEVHYRGMIFSPDGNYVYYVKLEKYQFFSPFGMVYQVPKLGGATKKILTDVSSPVTFSPDGKRLAFVRSSPGEDTLMLANSDGTGEQKLAVLAWPEVFSGGGRGGAAVPGGGPAWSPDGKVIACPARIKDAGSTAVVEVRVADGAVKLIAKGWNSIDRVEWLRDGTGLVLCALSDLSAQIWYLAYPGGESRMITHDLNDFGDVSVTADSGTLVAVQIEFLSNVWVLGFNQATTNARQITNGKMDGYCGVSWTPDDKIVYAARKIKYADLWMMDADGGNQKQLTDDEPADRFPSVTPDGRSIVFDSIGRGAGSWRMDSDGGNIKRLTERGIVPHCSSDGKWVTYQLGQPGSSVWKVSIDGGQPERLTLEDKIAARPAFSPDGKQIACFYKEDRTAPWKIAILPSEGGQPIKVFDNPVTLNRFFVFRWTPDGRAILYVDESGGVSNIWSQPVDGGKPAQVTDFKSDLIYTFDLSRDGKRLAVTRGAVTGDIVMMSALRQ